MTQNLSDLLKTILSMLEKQSEAINKLTESQLNLALAQTGIVSRHERLVQMNEEWLAVQQNMAERQERIIENFQSLFEKMAQIDKEYQENDSFLRNFYDMYFDDLNSLKRRIAELENKA